MSLLPQWYAGAGAAQRPAQRLPQVPYLRYLQGSNAQARQTRPFAPTALGQTVPSWQRYRKLAPSEQQGYQGYLSDELGVDPNDVMWLMNKLRPAGAVSAIPRWVR